MRTILSVTLDSNLFFSAPEVVVAVGAHGVVHGVKDNGGHGAIGGPHSMDRFQSGTRVRHASGSVTIKVHGEVEIITAFSAIIIVTSAVGIHWCALILGEPIMMSVRATDAAQPMAIWYISKFGSCSGDESNLCEVRIESRLSIGDEWLVEVDEHIAVLIHTSDSSTRMCFCVQQVPNVT